MATTQSMGITSTSTQLIENTPKEQILAKINEMRQKNITAKQKAEINDLEIRIGKSFSNLTTKYFGIDEGQTQQLSDHELQALFAIVRERAHEEAIRVRIWCIISIFGMMPLYLEQPSPFKTINLTNAVTKLKKMLGDSFDPVKIIRKQA